ncbi:MAG: sigma-70 family RNA polymerase sigma factor [Phycisphaerae bacterium]|nr:sigma-70 family RNA polymerase sigma factor [Phycisphaerae bacterium]
MTDSNELNDIVVRCQNGESQAYDELVDMFGTSLYGYFYRLSGNSEVSNDLLSELFMKLVQKIGSYKGGSFKKWVFTIASNIFYDYLRHRYRQKKLLDGKADTIGDSTLQLDGASDLRDELEHYLAKLDTDTAEILMLRFFGQLSFKELADLRGEPIGTTLSKVHRGLKKMRAMMEESGPN